MSKFLSIIEALVPGNKGTTSAATSAVVDAINKKPDSDLSPAEKKVKSAYINKMNKVVADLAAPLMKEEETDEVAQEPTPGENTTTLSPEGEVFYVDLMKKALFVDLDNIELNNTEKEVVTNDVTPTNAKQVAEVIRKIINDFGLGV